MYLFDLSYGQIIEDEEKPGMWEEVFKTHSDSKPDGTLRFN